jgi:TRL-like protein family
MKRWVLVIFAFLFLVTASGCGFVAEGPFGWAYTNSKSPVAVGTAKTVYKTGRACIHSLFGMVTIGDASIETAMRSSGLKQVYTIDTENLSFFGTYTRVCTIVGGV